MALVSAIPGSEPFHLDGGNVAVLMIHGFTGSPLSVKPWAEALHKSGVSVRVPLLPGHGRTWQEMNETKWQGWFAEVEENFNDLKKKYSQIFVAGFSMGGALALHLAQLRGREIEGLILINPSIQDRRPIMSLVPVLKYFVPSVGGRGTDVAAPNPPRHSYGRTPLKALHSLQDLWRDVGANLDKVEAPLMIGYSINDHVVDPINSQIVIDNVSSVDIREVIFERSFHNVALDYDLDILSSESLSFIHDVLTGDVHRENDFDQRFDEIVSGLNLDESAPTTYLDELDRNEAEGSDRYLGDNSPMPRLTEVQRAALVCVILGPVAAFASRFFDPFGLGTWPGLLLLLVGIGTFFWQMRPENEDEDGAAL